MFKKLLNKFQTMLIELEVYNLSDKIIPVSIHLKILAVVDLLLSSIDMIMLKNCKEVLLWLEK